MAFLRTLNQNLGMTMIIVTHDLAIATQVDRTIAIRDGRTSTETVRREQTDLQLSSGSPILPISSVSSGSAVIGLPDATHQEAIFIDRSGLLQLPADVLERVPLRGRVEVYMAQDHLELWPVGMHDQFYPAMPVANQKSAVIGLPAQTHRETIMVDRVGRLQLPQQPLEALPFRGRAHIRVARSHIQLWPSSQDSFEDYAGQNVYQ
jgi:energy-coupling factor transporter ATP-binding protein EcfA2